MPDIISVSSDHDTDFTKDDLIVRDAMAASLTDFLKKLDAWETICKKYQYDKKGKNYGQGADALTVISNIRVCLNEQSTTMLEGR